MQYVCSEIHGRYDKWCALLAALDLKPTDTLYVLGDVIDRGPDGIKVLQDMAQRLNVIPILGNHELDAALCIPKLLQEVTDESIAALSGKDFAALSEWLQNGGGPTLRGLQQSSPAEREELLDYLRNMDLYAAVEAGGRNFVLTHAGLDHFEAEKPLEDYELLDFLLGRPNPLDEIWHDKSKFLVYGHTPTRVLREQMGESPADTILRCGQQIAIDCACVFNGKLGCLCLDTLEEIYV